MGIPAKTPKFRAAFVKLKKPKPVGGNEDKLQYSLVALFAPGTDLSALKKAEAEALKAKFGAKAADVYKHPKYKSPFKDQAMDFVDKDGKPYKGQQAGGFFLNLGNEDRPAVFDQQLNEIIDLRDFYSGCYAVAKVDVFSWEHVTGGRGTTFSILGVQKVAEGEPLSEQGGRASVSDFEPVEGASAGADASSLFD